MFENCTDMDLDFKISIPWYRYVQIGCTERPRFWWSPIKTKKIKIYKNLVFKFKVDCLTEIMKRNNLDLASVGLDLIKELYI